MMYYIVKVICLTIYIYMSLFIYTAQCCANAVFHFIYTQDIYSSVQWHPQKVGIPRPVMGGCCGCGGVGSPTMSTTSTTSTGKYY